jgi:hypothetical protein
VSDLQWQWERASRAYGNYGNANQWTVNAGLASLARESAQNTNDARGDAEQAELAYTFIRLTGDDREAFEDSMQWEGLCEHLEAMGTAAAGAVAAGQIRAGVQALRDSESLLLLKISDYGCRGLTGPEFPEDGVNPDDFGNFIRLCRLDLFSGKDKASGGSFGLGKAVYWRFSRLQTVLFNSCLYEADAVDGQTQNRLFGVNQGVLHTLNGMGFQGRGYFGVPDAQDDVASVWADTNTVRVLQLSREDDRPGTTALMVGFYDPDSPERGLEGGAGLIEMAKELQAGVEESFWPLLARDRLRVRFRVVDDGRTTLDDEANPEGTYTELVRALRRFDKNEIDEKLDEPYSVVVRDVPIKISERRDGEDDHASFVHEAKLVVTLSDDQTDSLEDRVCLVRRPEMVVQTIHRPFEGRKFHAFLLAGAAINPKSPSKEELRADDFLRFAEPPAHDRWIPGSGRYQASQANLTARYVAPWIPNLKAIETNVLDALFELFGDPPVENTSGPEAIMKHLRFLKGEAGKGGTGGGALRRPEIILSDWHVDQGRWDVTFEIVARNEPEGWLIEPQLRFVGLDGTGTKVDWASLEVISGGELADANIIRIPNAGNRRKVTTVVHGTSASDLPIPADESAIDVIVGRIKDPKSPSGGEVNK